MFRFYKILINNKGGQVLKFKRVSSLFLCILLSFILIFQVGVTTAYGMLYDGPKTKTEIKNGYEIKYEQQKTLVSPGH